MWKCAAKFIYTHPPPFSGIFACGEDDMAQRNIRPARMLSHRGKRERIATSRCALLAMTKVKKYPARKKPHPSWGFLDSTSVHAYT